MTEPLSNVTDRAFGVHAQSLALRGQRAQVLATNLANADTPGYLARDMDFGAALQGATHALELRQTHAGHRAADTGLAGGELRYRVPMQPALDGNTVEPAIEHAAYGENAVRYMASLEFLGGRIRTLTAALRGE